MVRITPTLPSKTRPRATKRSQAQLDAQAEHRAARQAEATRRLDARRKIVIGAAVMELATRDPSVAKFLNQVKRNLPRPADRKLFEMDD